MLKIAINAVIVTAIVIYGIGMYNKLHFEPAPVEAAPPSTAAPKDGLAERVASVEKQAKEALEFKKTEELKADKFQCKTDPLVTQRLDALEKWQKNFDEQDKEMAKQLDGLLKDIKGKAEEKPKEDRSAKVDWVYDIDVARQRASQTSRPIWLSFNQSRALCEKCYHVRENCYKDAKCFGEISRNFVPMWTPTGWSNLTNEYEVSGFPTVVIDYGNGRRKSFSPSEDPERFLAQVKEFEL